jgi:hypothetical protein
VQPATLEKIFAAAVQIGYVPNPVRGEHAAAKDAWLRWVRPQIGCGRVAARAGPDLGPRLWHTLGEAPRMPVRSFPVGCEGVPINQRRSRQAVFVPTNMVMDWEGRGRLQPSVSAGAFDTIYPLL